MARLHTPDQFTTPTSLTAVGVVGFLLGGALTLRALDTGSWWQYLGAIVLFTLSVRLIKRAFKTKK